MQNMWFCCLKFLPRNSSNDSDSVFYKIASKPDGYPHLNGPQPFTMSLLSMQLRRFYSFFCLKKVSSGFSA